MPETIWLEYIYIYMQYNGCSFPDFPYSLGEVSCMDGTGPCVLLFIYPHQALISVKIQQQQEVIKRGQVQMAKN
jgi:hypothetical protein